MFIFFYATYAKIFILAVVHGSVGVTIFVLRRLDIH